MSVNYPVSSRVRAYGKARLEVARRAASPQERAKLWKPPAHPFPFVWGQEWKQCVEYKVDDYAAEVGFLIDVLGLVVKSFDPEYAMFTSPRGDFLFSVAQANEDYPSTPPDALRIQFMLADILETAAELEQRGIQFEQPPQPCQPGSSLHIGYFRTPHGICIDLWGMVEQAFAQERAGDEIEEQDFAGEDEQTEEPEAENQLAFPGLAPLPKAEADDDEEDDDWDESEWEEDEEEKEPYRPVPAAYAPAAPQPPARLPATASAAQPAARGWPAALPPIKPGGNGHSSVQPPKPKPPEPEYVDED